MADSLTFLDVFAGGGGLSEGFVRAGFSPVAHIEQNQAACYTLKTRVAYHYLKYTGNLDSYIKYLKREITRSELYGLIPDILISSVINAEINKKNLPAIFRCVDDLLNGQKLDIIVGGPPCQAYSLIGRSRDKNRMLGDSRNWLYIYYAEFLKRYKPRYFVFENVKGLLSATSPDRTLYIDGMRSLFLEHGYETDYHIIAADKHGVLQRRSRVILVGRKGKKSGFWSEPELWSPGVKVREVLGDLPSIKAGGGSPFPTPLKSYKGDYLYKAGIRNGEVPVTWHFARPHTEQDLEIYQIAVRKWDKKKERLAYNDLPDRLISHKNRSSFIDRFKVVAGDLPSSQTVVAHISRDGHYYIHPDIKQNRSLSPREAARLQTFPDDYYFEGVHERIPGRTPAYNQIGNAVPVLLAQKIGEKLKDIWYE